MKPKVFKFLKNTLASLLVTAAITFSTLTNAQTPIERKERQQKLFFLQIEGRVFDADAELPISGAYVLMKEIFHNTVVVRTDSLGFFKMRGIHIQEGIIEIVHKDYESKKVNMSRTNNGPYKIYLQPHNAASCDGRP